MEYGVPKVGCTYTITRKIDYPDESSCVWVDGLGPFMASRFVVVDSLPMTLNEYQTDCMRTAGDRTGIRPLAMGGLGIAGEAGEVADIIKKHLFHGHPLDVSDVKKELGDVLWYIGSIAAACGLTLEDVATANIEKLRKRYPHGFSVEASLNRSE